VKLLGFALAVRSFHVSCGVNDSSGMDLGVPLKLRQIGVGCIDCRRVALR
jgi:hypothetical protein